MKIQSSVTLRLFLSNSWYCRIWNQNLVSLTIDLWFHIFKKIMVQKTAHSFRTLKKVSVMNMQNRISRQYINVISTMDYRFMNNFKTYKYSTLILMLIGLIEAFTSTRNHAPTKRLFFKRLVNQCHWQQRIQQSCCCRNVIPRADDTQKRYYVSNEGGEETGIGVFYEKNLAKISPLLKKTNIDFSAIHLDLPSRIWY